MKNKGFVLMETIVVIVVISVALLTIFSSYNKILRKVKSENKYDTSEYIYMTNYIKKYLQDCDNNIVKDAYDIMFDDVLMLNKAVNWYTWDICKLKTNLDNSGFQVKKIYILTNLNEFGKKTPIGYRTTEVFDAYMNDYIRKLDVENTDKLIIVEYRRPVLKLDGAPKQDSLGNQLYETYIASLEW